MVRPPATEAHYHNPESEQLLKETISRFVCAPDARILLLPRNKRQEADLRSAWPDAIARRQILIPDHVEDGLNLIWNSDLVISGGGTMNREAAALGVPVYSIFRGKIGAVDAYLADQGRLVLLETVEDVRTKIKTVRRDPHKQRLNGENSPALDTIVQNIISIVESKTAVPVHQLAIESLLILTAERRRVTFLTISKRELSREMTNTLAVLASETRVAQLVEMAIRGLEAMYNEEQGLFCHRLKQTPSGNIKEGISQRYTVMTLLGLLRAEAAGYRSSIDVYATIDALYRNTEWVDNIGDLGLLLWLSSVSCRKLDSFCAAFDLENALRNYSDARKRLTMELAWFLTGLTYASRAERKQRPFLEPLARQTYTLLQSNQGKDGLFGHWPSGSRWQERCAAMWAVLPTRCTLFLRWRILAKFSG